MHEVKSDWFSDIDEIVSDDLRFKAALNIGEDAYTSLKIKKTLFEFWDVYGAATAGANIAASSVVASHFFSAGGILGILGVGTAVTPVGWIIAAGVITGGSWFGITSYLRTNSDNVTVIPNFINTPLDFLALSLFDLNALLSMKIAAIDGHIVDEEIEVIRNYFIRKWGYSTEFTDQGLAFIREKIQSVTIHDIATALATFTRDNPDCNFTEMTQAIIAHLNEIAAADGKIDEREVMAIEKIKQSFEYEAPLSIPRHLNTIGSSLTNAGERVKNASSIVSETVSDTSTTVGKTTSKFAFSAGKTFGSIRNSVEQSIGEIKKRTTDK
ncbi:MAG: TerB family tellurite resistance protein [Alphaproteobacteria bacterium]|nr:TerB family tellurite resistance protein [Alphaproteobacteria bacterium]